MRKRDYFTRYGEQARVVLDALLQKYADGEVRDLEDRNVLKLRPFDTMGTSVELARQFGGNRQYGNAIRELTQELYQHPNAS